MFNTVLSVTSILLIISGITVMAMGEWRQLRLKFAAVAFSTASAIFLAIVHLRMDGPTICTNTALCLQYSLYGVIRNTCFVIFHIACGRDAILLKHCDRRCCTQTEGKRHAGSKP